MSTGPMAKNCGKPTVVFYSIIYMYSHVLLPTWFMSVLFPKCCEIPFDKLFILWVICCTIDCYWMTIKYPWHCWNKISKLAVINELITYQIFIKFLLSYLKDNWKWEKKLLFCFFSIYFIRFCLYSYHSCFRILTYLASLA